MAFQELFEHEIAFQPGSPEQMQAIWRRIPAGGGVYLLTDEHDRVIQLASSGDLRRALRIRLSTPPAQPVSAGEGESAVTPASPAAGPARPRADLSRIVRRIWWRAAHSMFEVDLDYCRLARRLMPDSYLRSLAFGPAWFVHVDPAGAIPRFLPGKLLRSPPGIDLGPFATQADANRFVQTIEDIFDLCRYDHILEQVPHGQPCAYFEMGRCPAPCNGTIPMSAYRQTIAEGLAFARGERQERYALWDGQMREAAEVLAFEKAALLKQRVERARTLDHAAFRLVRPIDEFRWLIIQRAGGRTRVKPFFVKSGRIDTGEPAKLNDIDTAATDWIARLLRSEPSETVSDPAGSGPAADPEGRQQASEHVWLVSHYLFKREVPGLFLHYCELGEPGDLADRIRLRFAPKLSPGEKPAAHGPRESISSNE